MATTELPQYIDTPIDSLDEVYNRLTETFLSHRTLPIEYRLYNLKQLAFLLTDNEARIQAAVKADLDKGAFDVNLSEIWPVLNEIDLAVKRLPQWMKDDKGTTDATPMFKLNRPRVVKQPKGVSLIIGAWNYPWQLTLSPLVGAIAAGCPAIIKTSEHAPTSAALLAELLPQYLDRDGYAVAVGAAEHSTALLTHHWGHIIYTGSGAVGKIVAGAAAKTLTPTTLELGGKSPVIIAPDADMTITARRMMSMKQVGAGQVCVSPDYVLCVKERVEDLKAELKKTLEFFYPAGSERSLLKDGGLGCSLRASRDFDRLNAALKEADDQGKLIYKGEQDASRRRMGINLVELNKDAKGEEGLFAQEEVFGPVLSIIAVDDVDAAIRYVNARPNPLALYVCSSSRTYFDKIVHQTVSGSAIWNDFALAPICRTLPFGGVGESGWGAYHGYDGFLTFSHRKAVMEVPLWMEIAQKSRYAPNLNEKAQRMMKLVMTSGISFKRPVSLEGERRAIERARNRNRLYIGVVLVLIGAWVGIAGRASARRIGSILGALRGRIGL